MEGDLLRYSFHHGRWQKPIVGGTRVVPPNFPSTQLSERKPKEALVKSCAYRDVRPSSAPLAPTKVPSRRTIERWDCVAVAQPEPAQRSIYAAAAAATIQSRRGYSANWQARTSADEWKASHAEHELTEEAADCSSSRKEKAAIPERNVQYSSLYLMKCGYTPHRRVPDKVSSEDLE